MCAYNIKRKGGLMTTNEENLVNEYLDNQLDNAMDEFNVEVENRMNSLSLSTFTRNYLKWEIDFEKECDETTNAKHLLSIINNETARIKSLTDIEFINKFGGVVTPELIGEMNSSDIITTFSYIMDNIEDWVERY